MFRTRQIEEQVLELSFFSWMVYSKFLEPSCRIVVAINREDTDQVNDSGT